MILSYHPCFEADKNLICAGRNPDSNDLALIQAADALVLPQGCYESLYKMARDNCPNVFPNYDARFRYPGKIGQVRLFQKTGVGHPKSLICLNMKSFPYPGTTSPETFPLDFPFVFKFDWGGEGKQVCLIKSLKNLEDALKQAEDFERTGQTGFVIQEYIPSQNRTLRVVVIGRQIVSYWRIQTDPDKFGSGLANGSVIDTDCDPDLQEKAVTLVKNFCKKTKINLAGFDVIFSSETEIIEPLLLEINYFFGRYGLGGSEWFYEILATEINRWIDDLCL